VLDDFLPQDGRRRAHVAPRARPKGWLDAFLRHVYSVLTSQSMSWMTVYNWPVLKCPRLAGFGCPPRGTRIT
jgi:hypothetical protein